MRQYLARRLLLVIPTIVLVSMIVFGLVRMIPGDVVELMVQENSYAPDLAAMRSRLGLDQPIPVQYANWLQDLAKGNLGQSFWTKRTILEEVQHRGPVTLELGALALVFAIVIGIPIGVLSAVRQDTAADYIFRSVAITFLAIPAFWLGILVIVVPSKWLGWTPTLGYVPFGESPWRNLVQFALPAVILSARIAGSVMRMTRTMMLEVLREDYVRTAWAKGLRERVVVFRHAAKNAMIPVVTDIGLHIPFLVGSTVIIEQIFTLPGLGQFIVEAINRRDYPVVQALTLVFAIVVIFCNLVVDMLYSYLDPRIRYRT